MSSDPLVLLIPAGAVAGAATALLLRALRRRSRE
jgi:hypothetical protein